VNRFAVSAHKRRHCPLLVTSPPAFAEKSPQHPTSIVTGNCSAAMEVHGNAQSPGVSEPCWARRVVYRTKDCGLSGSATPPSDELLYWLFNHAESKKIAPATARRHLPIWFGIGSRLNSARIKEAAFLLVLGTETKALCRALRQSPAWSMTSKLQTKNTRQKARQTFCMNLLRIRQCDWAA